MAVKIRLTRLGDKGTPFYRIVVADSRTARDGKVIDQLGTYNPLAEKDNLQMDKEKAAQWIKNGAQPTETARTLLVKSGVIAKKEAKPYDPKKVTGARKEAKK